MENAEKCPLNYRKRSIIIEAMQLQTNNINNLCSWCHGAIAVDKKKYVGLVIHTLEGNLTADFGDFIIRGIKGEFYPCKPDIFDMIYELVDENTRASTPEAERGDIQQAINVMDEVVSTYCITAGVAAWQILRARLLDSPAPLATKEPAEGEALITGTLLGEFLKYKLERGEPTEILRTTINEISEWLKSRREGR